MLQDFVIKQAAPIIENRVKEIIIGIAKEYNLQAPDLRTMFKSGNGHIRIYVFKDRKKVTEVPLHEVKGNIGNIVETKLKAIFIAYSLVYKVHTAHVNFIMQMSKNGVIAVRSYINDIQSNNMTVAQFLGDKPNTNNKINENGNT
ncbi:MAG: hypothetical protein ACTSXL_05990 [Alphaproteobacteria bacterium]